MKKFENIESLSAPDQRLLSDIKEFGVHIVHVQSDNESAGFSFSVGLYSSYKHPEIIIVGLSQELSQVLINNIALEAKSGRMYESNTYYEDILDNFKCLMVSVDKENYEPYLGYARWYYENDDFPTLQCIYPTTKGQYPWDSDAPEDFKNYEPILGALSEEIIK